MNSFHYNKPYYRSNGDRTIIVLRRYWPYVRNLNQFVWNVNHLAPKPEQEKIVLKAVFGK